MQVASVCLLLLFLSVCQCKTKLRNPGVPIENFQCGPNQVLGIYDHVLPYAIFCVCLTPPICKEHLQCTSSSRACPSTEPSGLRFLQKVNEPTKYNTLQKGCCTYKPEPDEYVSTSCEQFEVTDKWPESLNQRQPTGKRQKPSRRFWRRQRRRANWKNNNLLYLGVLKERYRHKRAAQQGEVNKVGAAEVYLHKLRKEPDQILLVNDLKRIRDGYAINGCTIKCQETTTTSTTTPITRPSRRSKMNDQPNNRKSSSEEESDEKQRNNGKAKENNKPDKSNPDKRKKPNQDESEEEKSGLGKYKCKKDHVLAMIGDERPYAILTHCVKYQICNHDLSCTSKRGACSSPQVSGLSFLQGVDERLKYDDELNKQCCTYRPEPDEYESTTCYKFSVTDKPKSSRNRRPKPSTYERVSNRRRFRFQRSVDTDSMLYIGELEVGRKIGSRRNKDVETADSRRRFQRSADTEDMLYIGELEVGRRWKRGARRNKEVDAADMFIFNLLKDPKITLLVNDIKRISNGYTLNGCMIECKDTTTTTSTTPTTPSPRSQSKFDKDKPQRDQPDGKDDTNENNEPKKDKKRKKNKKPNQSGSSEEEEEGLGQYKCNSDHVLALYDQELPYAVYTHCHKPTVCQQQLSCTPQRGTCSSRGLGFLQGVDEKTKYDPLNKECCKYRPEPDEYESLKCSKFSVTDKSKRTRRLRQKLKYQRISGRRRTHRSADTRGMLYLGELDLKRRWKRGARSDEDAAEAFLYGTDNELDHDPNTKILVKDIKRITNGYTVNGCLIRCKDTTTTSTTTESTRTTKKKKERPALGSYDCPANHVLAIYENQSPNFMSFVCIRADVCQQELGCMPSGGACPSPRVNGLGFLQKLHEETKYDTLDKNCCTYSPSPDEFVRTVCSTYKIIDQTRNRYSSSSSSSSEERTRNRHRNKGISSEELWDNMRKHLMTMGKRRRRMKRSNDGKAAIEKYKIEENPKADGTLLLVNDIQRMRNGYKINGCQITCRRTTTTQRTPSTKRQEEDFERPEYVDEEIPEEELPKPKPKPKPKEPEITDTKHTKPEVPEPPPAPKPVPQPPPPPPAIVPPPPAPCFAAHTELQTPNGTKRMDQIAIGDQVLVTVSGGVDVYEPIEMWYHRLPDQSTEFMVLATAGDELWLTPGHLLPLVPCSLQALSSSILQHSIFASRARPGMCLVRIQDGQMTSEPLVTVERRRARGIYSPITEHGSVVVDHVLSSCFTTLENHNAQHNLHYILRYAYDWYQTITNIHLQEHEYIDIPLPMRLVIELAYLIVPESMFF